jgi:hypothetical protein
MDNLEKKESLPLTGQTLAIPSTELLTLKTLSLSVTPNTNSFRGNAL